VEDELSPHHSDLDKFCGSPKCVTLDSTSKGIQEMISRIVRKQNVPGNPVLFCVALLSSSERDVNEYFWR
jgi:hypothetical protein